MLWCYPKIPFMEYVERYGISKGKEKAQNSHTVSNIRRQPKTFRK